MGKGRARFSRLGVLAPAALSVCIDASVLAAPAAGAVLSTVLKELSKAFMLKKWFHGDMSAREAEQLLMQKGKNGSYLVRESQTHPGEYVLSVRVRGRVSHVMIRREHNKYDVGSGEIFDDLTGLIEHCRAYPLTEKSGDILRLLQPVNGTKAKTMFSPDAEPVENSCDADSASRTTPDEQPVTLNQSEEEVAGAMAIEPSPQSSCQSEEEVAGVNAIEPNQQLLQQSEEDLVGAVALDPDQQVFEQCQAEEDVIRATHRIDQQLFELNLQLQDLALDESLNLESPKYNEPAPTYPSGGPKDFIDVEFNSLSEVERNTRFTTFVAKRQENIYKNRYSNVLPYDQTRVILPRVFISMDERFNDYINASYIKPAWMLEREFLEKQSFALSGGRHSAHSSKTGAIPKEITFPSQTNVPPKEKESTASFDDISGRFEIVKDKFYIATQACLSFTKYSFWLMITSEDVRVIVMVTNLYESGKNKCDMYWPPIGKRELVIDIEVYTVNEYFHPYYITREIQLRKPDGKIQTVYQYQYQNWPDHSIPISTKKILRFIRDVNARMYRISQDKATAPRQNIICVHCTAGIGRTGAFIALDMLIDTLLSQEQTAKWISINEVSLDSSQSRLDTPLDICGVVKNLRSQRAGMVQNKLQYEFLYIAVEDFIIETVQLIENNFAPVPPYVAY